MNGTDLEQALLARYPGRLAAEWDHIGFLVGNRAEEITGIVVSLDVTPEAVALAKASGANLILSHHPVIFGGLNTVTEDSLVWKLIRNGLSVISMHTNLDAAAGGVNDVLCDVIGLTDTVGLSPVADGFEIRMGLLPSALNAADFAAVLKEKLHGTVSYTPGSTPLRRIAVCSGSGSDFLALAKENGADALVTADVKHHVYGEARRTGIALFDCGHFETEDVIVEPLAQTLRELTGLPVLTCHESGIRRI